VFVARCLCAKLRGPAPLHRARAHVPRLQHKGAAGQEAPVMPIRPPRTFWGTRGPGTNRMQAGPCLGPPGRRKSDGCDQASEVGVRCPRGAAGNSIKTQGRFVSKRVSRRAGDVPIVLGTQVFQEPIGTLSAVWRDRSPDPWASPSRLAAADDDVQGRMTHGGSCRVYGVW